MCVKYYELRYMFEKIAPHQSWRVCSIDTASKFALFLVSGLKDEKWRKKQTYKTKTRKLYSSVFWTFTPNVIKNDPFNFEL